MDLSKSLKGIKKQDTKFCSVQEPCTIYKDWNEDKCPKYYRIIALIFGNIFPE
jgi:hypothetical protein